MKNGKRFADFSAARMWSKALVLALVFGVSGIAAAQPKSISFSSPDLVAAGTRLPNMNFYLEAARRENTGVQALRGKTFRIIVAVDGTGTMPVPTFSSSNSRASVDENGVVTVHEAGSDGVFVITATFTDSNMKFSSNGSLVYGGPSRGTRDAVQWRFRNDRNTITNARR